MKPYDQQVGRSKEKTEGRIEIFLIFYADIFFCSSWQISGNKIDFFQ